jgi:hypothetical protein
MISTAGRRGRRNVDAVARFTNKTGRTGALMKMTP